MEDLVSGVFFFNIEKKNEYNFIEQLLIDIKN